MEHVPSRRTFVKQASLLVAGVQFAPWLKVVAAADLGSAVADTSAGRVRGVVIDGVNVFKGIPYGASTSGKNRFRAPVKPTPWTGTRDALAYGATAPQTSDNSGTTAAGSESRGRLSICLPPNSTGRMNGATKPGSPSKDISFLRRGPRRWPRRAQSLPAAR